MGRVTTNPVRTTAEAADRIEQLTGIRRQPTQTRVSLAGLGFAYERFRAIPVPPKTPAEHVATQRGLLAAGSKPRPDAAVAGRGQVWFVDAAHCVYGAYLCCLWSVARVFVRAASGRQRFNALGAWNAATRAFVSVVNTDTMCALPRGRAALGPAGPVAVVLDNARYQRNKVVMASAEELGTGLPFLPSYSPNLNPIERLWRFVKRRSMYGSTTRTSPRSGPPSSPP